MAQAMRARLFAQASAATLRRVRVVSWANHALRPEDSRKATGMPVHQYVIRRCVERAALLLREGKLPISQIAMELGFAHQSHLAMHMKRLLSVSPSHVLGSAR
jgi:methylphosphotriester-DNA--protein-cysteine methyltransferase